LQERRELAPKQKMIGFECTIAVTNTDQAIRAIQANGGRLAAPKAHIPTVGTVAYFFDTEGNVAGIIQQEQEA
jgi:predicted enzyme related to lactoylglutathione lyase